jgi:hypothetical protein
MGFKVAIVYRVKFTSEKSGGNPLFHQDFPFSKWDLRFVHIGF